MSSTAKKLKQLLGLARSSKRAVIVIYGNVDPDALASAWALKTIFSWASVKSTIGYTGHIGRLENENMMRTLKIPAFPVNREALEKADLIALVDAQPTFFRDYELPRCDIVIDHHPKEKKAQATFFDIRPECLATCTIVTNYLIALKKPVPVRLATALYHGLMTDSHGLRRGPSRLDKTAIVFLEKHADKSLLANIEFSQYSLGGLDYFGVALAKRRYARDVLYAHLGPVPYTDVCAQVADFLIRVREIHTAVVSGVVDQTLVIVFRCDSRRKDAGRLAQGAFGKIGSGGGHKPMGRAEVDEIALPRGVNLTQNETVERFVVGALTGVDKDFGPLFKSLPSEHVRQSEAL